LPICPESFRQCTQVVFCRHYLLSGTVNQACKSDGERTSICVYCTVAWQASMTTNKTPASSNSSVIFNFTATARVQHWREREREGVIGKGCLVLYPLPHLPPTPQYQPPVPARNCATFTLSRSLLTTEL
jgi:hypothetical protein